MSTHNTNKHSAAHSCSICPFVRDKGIEESSRTPGLRSALHPKGQRRREEGREKGRKVKEGEEKRTKDTHHK